MSGNDAGQWLKLFSALTSDPELEDARHLRLDGIDVWPVIKATSMMIALNEMQGVYKLGKANFGRVLYRRVKTMIGRRAEQTARQKRSIKADFFCVANIAPTLSFAGTRINPHLDPVRISLARQGKTSVASYYDLTNPIGMRFALPSEASVDVSPPLNPALNSQDKRGLQLALRSSVPLLSLHFKRHGEAIASRIAATLRLRRIYQDFLERSQITSGILLTNYYNPHGWGVVAAAHSLGIPTFDFQHGVQGEYHHAYSWSELTDAIPNTVPDRFVCWSKADAANFDRNAVTRDRAITAGPSHFQLEALSTESNHDTGQSFEIALDDFRAQTRLVQEMSRRDRERHSLIVGLFLQYREDEEWLRILRNNTPENIHIWVRRHPGVRRRAAKSATPDYPGFTVIDDAPLAAVLRCLDLAVTGYSSIGIEAAHIGCPVLAYSPLALQWLKPYCIDTGFELTMNDPKALGLALANFQHAQQMQRATSLPPIERVTEKILRFSN